MSRYPLSALLLVGMLPLVLAGCGGEAPPPRPASGDHVWKAQTDTLQKARDAERVIMEAAERERQAIDKQTGADTH